MDQEEYDPCDNLEVFGARILLERHNNTIVKMLDALNGRMPDTLGDIVLGYLLISGTDTSVSAGFRKDGLLGARIRCGSL